MKISLAAALATLLTISVVATAPALMFTITADNIVGAWYKDGGSPVAIGLPTDSSLSEWRNATTVSVDPGCYSEIIFQVLNDDNDSGYRLPGTGNPGGFLAEISGSLGPGTSSLLSDGTWEVSWLHMTDPYVSPTASEWATINTGWTGATEWALNSGPYVEPNPKGYTGNNIWYNGRPGAIPGISGDAKWIWTYANFDMPGAPGNDVAGSGAPGDAVFIKATISSVPEPGTLLLLGTGLVGLAGYGLRRKKK